MNEEKFDFPYIRFRGVTYVPQPKDQKPIPPSNITRTNGGLFTVVKTCANCNSSLVRSGFLGLFGEFLCINKECINSISRIKRD